MSVCQVQVYVRLPSCTDERVAYRIKRGKSGGALLLEVLTRVNGREVAMRSYPCRFEASVAELDCAYSTAYLRFTIRADSLLGEMTLPNGTKFREIRTARSR